VCLNRGSAIAKIVGTNAQRHDTIDERVTMYVYEEMINGKKLTEIINETHENVKYLPGIRLPPNVVSCQVLLLIILMTFCFGKYISAVTDFSDSLICYVAHLG
jgi:glycerol-3-phosphate dehydrogenase